ncbi:T-cell antigen CD7 [Apus apus]|uniref:T-cell antigen CD7 n=1 Tax=Apus apus TaxID=8895 RepID=UPI0021F8B335|nr:T-cell antigen CD7 [Apus apus]
MLWISWVPTASLLLLLCFPGQNGEENEQSTDTISVWEGDSINIICSMGDSENELVTTLTTSIRLENVIQVSKQGPPYIHPALANRTEYSKDGRNLRVTLHNAQESDSDIYQCFTFLKPTSYHKKLRGKTTIVLVKGNTSGAVEQSPLYVDAEQGQSVSITCALQNSQEDKGIYLLKTHMQREQVLFVSGQNVSTVSPAFADRLEYSKGENKIVVTLHNLQKNDSDIYVCAGVLKGSRFLSANRSGTMMLVKEVKQTGCSSSSWGIYGLTIMVVILFSALMCSILSRVNLKQCFKNKRRNEVYEDMSYSSRRNTLVRANAYSC